MVRTSRLCLGCVLNQSTRILSGFSWWVSAMREVMDGEALEKDGAVEMCFTVH